MADVTPVDYTTDVGRVRKYIPDVVQLPDPKHPASTPEYMWADDAIASFIDDEAGLLEEGERPRWIILRAAASIMIATANNEALILKKIVTEDLQTDGPAVAKALIAAAEALRKRAKELEDAEAEAEIFISVPYVHTPARYEWR